MFRRWQKDAVDKYSTLESYNTFLSQLSPLDDSHAIGACDPADIYSVLSVLHSKGRQPQLRISKNPGFYYLLADAVQPCESIAMEPSGGAAIGFNTPYTDVRQEVVVPISSKSTQLTTETIRKFFQIEGHSNVMHVLLAVVDDDGSVSLVRVFNYLQPPFEGPEALPPVEIGGGAAVESDAD